MLPWQAVCCPLAIECLRFARLRNILQRQQEILTRKKEQLEAIVEDALRYNESELTKWIETEETRRYGALRAIEQKIVLFITTEKIRLEEVQKRRETQLLRSSREDLDTLSEGNRYSSQNMKLAFTSKCEAMRRHVSEMSVRQDITDLVSTVQYLEDEQAQQKNVREQSTLSSKDTGRLRLSVPAEARAGDHTLATAQDRPAEETLTSLISHSNQSTTSILKMNSKLQKIQLRVEEAHEYLSSLADNAVTFETAKAAMEQIKADLKAFDTKFRRTHTVAAERFKDRGNSVQEALSEVVREVTQITADLVTRERLVGRAITMYLARVLSSEPMALKSPFQQAEIVWDHKYMVDKAGAAERFAKKRFGDMLAEFLEASKLQRHRVAERMAVIQRTFSEISYEHNKNMHDKESDYDMLFKRHVSNVTSIRRAGQVQVKAFRRGMFAFEGRFNTEVLNLHSRCVWTVLKQLYPLLLLSHHTL